MNTQYLPFATSSQARGQSRSDWAVRILKHPTIATNTTSAFWGFISNPSTAFPGLDFSYGVFSDDVLATCTANYASSQLTSLQGSLLPASDAGVVATLAAIAATNPLSTITLPSS